MSSASLDYADPAWLLAGAALKVLSGLGYVVVFREMFCRRMSWRLSGEIGAFISDEGRTRG